MGFRPGDDPGRMAENIACMELLPESEVYHCRDSLGHEADFVIRQGREAARSAGTCLTLRLGRGSPDAGACRSSQGIRRRRRAGK